ncbi:DnaD domain protein [Alkalibacillus almallahensis]|uniref:DnaD domain protein n=1 Tax=Alkalibacillus almallahensis TaxID=1379154 RepID=UPI00142003C2|nr:DnaD domain protein [Alkalibacillus almallahensis]NIK10883.1 DnaD/phage-associated family protein [Alkalibacillus almallahensis]
MKGFIKDYRQELDSLIWSMPPMYHRVWQYLKYMVNHEERKVPFKDGSVITVRPGQHLTSVRNIAKGVGYYEGVTWKEPNPKTVRTILQWLEKQSMISVERGKGNRQYTLITLLNWETYQSQSVSSNTKETERNPEVKQVADINKNVKNEKNEEELSNNNNTRDREAFAEIIEFYKNNCQQGITESPFNFEVIEKLFDEWGYELLMASMQVAAQKEAKGTRFIESVLDNWKGAGVQSIDDARRYQQQFRENKQKTKQSRSSPKQTSDVIPKWFAKHKEQRQQEQQESTQSNEAEEPANVTDLKAFFHGTQ